WLRHPRGPRRPQRAEHAAHRAPAGRAEQPAAAHRRAREGAAAAAHDPGVGPGVTALIGVACEEGTVLVADSVTFRVVGGITVAAWLTEEGKLRELPQAGMVAGHSGNEDGEPVYDFEAAELVPAARQLYGHLVSRVPRVPVPAGATALDGGPL